jgi:hypothetical protein
MTSHYIQQNAGKGAPYGREGTTVTERTSEERQQERLRTQSQPLSLLHQLVKVLRSGAVVTVLA